MQWFRGAEVRERRVRGSSRIVVLVIALKVLGHYVFTPPPRHLVAGKHDESARARALSH